MSATFRDAQPASEPPGAAAQSAAPAEGFIPLRRSHLAAILADDPDLSADERVAFLKLVERLAARFHHEFHAAAEQLKTAYAPFDPDADTVEREESSANHAAAAQQLVDKFSWLLARANFRRLSHDDIESATQAASDWGVNLYVDFDAFEQLEVYARGERVDRWTRRRWWGWRSPLWIDVPLYRRLVVLFRFKPRESASDEENPDTIYIKVFKNIPRVDLDMLLPGSRVRMSLLDRGKIIVPTLSGGILTFIKLFQGIIAVATLGTLAIIGLITGSLGYGLRSFHGWLRHQQRYQLNLTRRLYYQNLDNNAGAFFRLVDEAEEQETREAILAWHLLWRRAGEAGWSIAELDRAAEDFLAAHADCRVDYDLHEALARLVQMGIVEKGADGRYRAASVETALARLDGAWSDIFRMEKP